MVEGSITANGYTRKWWKEVVVYQIYPRSFQDSNGDGIGDLNGITSRLDYLKLLGVDVLWLSPHYDSPNADNGYDIRDYRKVMTEFGTMLDFHALLKGIKERGMKMIVDLVVNHTSDEHAWFVESRKSKTGIYSDYYIWQPENNGRPPNNWTSFFSGSAWSKDPLRSEYYLHLFAEKQPDLNWDNPKVRSEVYDLMKFWLDKGIDGFRMDVIPFISKDPHFPDCPKEYAAHPEYIYAAGPKLHEYLQEMHREVLAKYNVMTVGEALGVTLEQTPLFVDERCRWARRARTPACGWAMRSSSRSFAACRPPSTRGSRSSATSPRWRTFPTACRSPGSSSNGVMERSAHWRCCRPTLRTRATAGITLSTTWCVSSKRA
jgi:oligo-1,6-glucosidase